MYARVLIGQTTPAQIDAFAQVLNSSIRETVLAQPGNLGFVALVDRATGKAMSLTFWATPDELAASESSGFLCRQLACVAGFLDGPVIRETYCVVSADDELPDTLFGREERPASPAG
jgi:hypothetical protein